MNRKKIQEARESGDRQIAVRLPGSMIYGPGLRQRGLKEFPGGGRHGD